MLIQADGMRKRRTRDQANEAESSPRDPPRGTESSPLDPPRGAESSPLDPPKGAARRNFLGRGNDAFTCHHCGLDVLPLVSGGSRSHCPECLWSRHVDEVPGDRSSSCGGLMPPISVERVHDTWYAVHRCEVCCFQRRNRLSLEDERQSDSWEAVIAISGQPST